MRHFRRRFPQITVDGIRSWALLRQHKPNSNNTLKCDIKEGPGLVHGFGPRIWRLMARYKSKVGHIRPELQHAHVFPSQQLRHLFVRFNDMAPSMEPPFEYIKDPDPTILDGLVASPNTTLLAPIVRDFATSCAGMPFLRVAMLATSVKRRIKSSTL